jgi:DNA primase
LLYRLPEVVAAISAGEPIYLVEGEKDTNTGLIAPHPG